MIVYVLCAAFLSWRYEMCRFYEMFESQMARMKRSVPTAAQYRRLKNGSLLLDLAAPRQSTFITPSVGSLLARRGEALDERKFSTMPRRCRQAGLSVLKFSFPRKIQSGVI